MKCHHKISAAICVERRRRRYRRARRSVAAGVIVPSLDEPASALGISCGANLSTISQRYENHGQYILKARGFSYCHLMKRHLVYVEQCETKRHAA